VAAHRLFAVLDRARWDGSTLELNGVEFEARMHEYAEWDRDHDRFLLLKPRPLIELYEQFWRGRPTPRRVMELGAWEGGSAAFWFEAFEPDKHVAVDLITRTDSERFKSYVASRGVADRLKTYWGVDQADRRRLREIVDSEFDGPIDLVIDDASHLYEPTKVSFEELFPRLRPGGLYVIEDWQWSYTDFEPPASWANKPPVSRLVLELLETVGRAPRPVASMTVLHNFAAVERAA
jgi:predicted O-methyltransferase YrrM